MILFFKKFQKSGHCVFKSKNKRQLQADVSEGDIFFKKAPKPLPLSWPDSCTLHPPKKNPGGLHVPVVEKKYYQIYLICM